METAVTAVAKATDHVECAELGSTDYAAIGRSVLNEAAREWFSEGRYLREYESFTFEEVYAAVQLRINKG